MYTAYRKHIVYNWVIEKLVRICANIKGIASNLKLLYPKQCPISAKDVIKICKLLLVINNT